MTMNNVKNLKNKNTKPFKCKVGDLEVEGVVSKKFYAHRDYEVEVWFGKTQFLFEIPQTSTNPILYSVGFVKYPKTEVPKQSVFTVFTVFPHHEWDFVKVEGLRNLPVEQAFEGCLNKILGLYKSL